MIPSRPHAGGRMDRNPCQIRLCIRTLNVGALCLDHSMLRTIAVLLLLLGLATVTPVVCLCAPSEAAGLMAGLQRADAAGSLGQATRVATDDRVASGQSLLATSAAAVVASLVAAAA